MPLKKYRIGLLFGMPYGSVLSKILGNKHQGLDLLPDNDDEVRPIGEGRVTQAIMTSGACGGLVDIEYENGLKSRYCHLQTIKVSKGVKVNKNTIVGIMGATGVSYPVGYKHLHFVLWQNNKLIDPLSLNYGEDALSQVNSLFRKVWDRQPLPKESGYFQYRVIHNDLTAEKLLDIMKYWHSKNRLLFIIEMQRYNFF